MRELEGENENLRMKIRALEIIQARPAKEEDERQQHLGVQYTESVKVEEDDAGAEAQTKAPTIPSSTTKRKPKKRQKIAIKLEALEVIKTTTLIPQEVKDRPDQWEQVSEIITREVLVVPTKLGIHQIVFKKYRSKIDRSAPLIISKAPIRFSSSYISASLAIYITLGKYLDHSPLYRLEKKFQRLGIDISRQSQSDIIEQMAKWFKPLYDHLDQRAKAGNYLQIDETFIKYINGKGAGTGQGYFWAIHSPGDCLIMRWIDNRRHENVETLIAGFNGFLQSDAYAAYNNYASLHPEIILLACWAHAFRKFRDALKHEPMHARAMMHLIGKLYDLEEEWDKQVVTDPERKLLRAEHSVPIAESIKAELDVYAADMTIPNNDFRVAVNYAANQWTELRECFNHGHTRLDTNLLESKFRSTKIGAKNWMWIGHPDAGQKSAIIYSILKTCEIHRINPQAYFDDALAKLIPSDARPSAELLEALVPKNWAAVNQDKLLKEQL